MKTFWVNGLNKMGIESGDYVLASEAKDQDDWNVKKLKELELEQIKANERIKELENQLSPLSSATPSYVAGLNERIKVLEDALFSKGAMFDAPCFCCGYNGPHYFDPRIHGCALRHHSLAKSLEVKP